MDTSDKMNKLLDLINSHVQLKDFARLVTGDLSHIGDAIIEGTQRIQHVRIESYDYKSFSFNAGADMYTVKDAEPKTTSLCGIEYPVPVREALKYDTYYYVADIYRVVKPERCTWKDDSYDREWLELGVLQLTKKGAIAQSKAYTAAIKEQKRVEAASRGCFPE